MHHIRLILFTCLLLLTPWTLLGPDITQAIQLQEHVETVSASDTNSTVTFTFDAEYILVVNDGPDTIYLTTASSVATTNDFPIKSGETWRWTSNGFDAVSTIGIICASTETATVRVEGLR